jgi:hypothetical protein
MATSLRWRKHSARTNSFGLSCFSHKPEKFRDKIIAKTCVGDKIGPDMKLLVPDVKVLAPDVEVLFPGCRSTGPWMCQIVSEKAAGKVGKLLRKVKSYG